MGFFWETKVFQRLFLINYGSFIKNDSLVGIFVYSMKKLVGNIQKMCLYGMDFNKYAYCKVCFFMNPIIRSLYKFS